jgi:hypothetical protein
MFKPAILLLFVLIESSAFAQALQSHRSESSAASSAAQAPQDDKQRRRDELRAALKSQGDEATATPAKTISSQDRAALREQLRVQGLTASPQH